MPTTQNNRKLLDTKQWEVLTYGRLNDTTTKALASIDHIVPLVMMASGVSSTTSFMYYPLEDGWMSVAPGTGSWGGGAVATASAWSTGSTLGVASLSATAGSTTTITTNQTLNRDLRGWKIHIMEGPNAGQTLTISSNTLGANSVITVPVQASAFSTATRYRFCTPRFWFARSGTSPFNFGCYDFATDTWLTPSVTGANTSLTSDSVFTATPSWQGSDYLTFATGTATSATSTTLVNSAKSWDTNQWTNYQIRITGGTGAGQIRTISSNTGTTITVPTWTITPDSTSTYAVEGNDDFLYLFGGAASSTTTYRYSISSNSWSSLTARPVTHATGATGCWISGSEESDWTSESSINNGRRIYWWSANTTSIYYYDIPSNSWTTLTTPGVSNNFFASNPGASFVAVGGTIYACPSTTSSTNGVRWFTYNCAKNEFLPWKVGPHVFGSNAVSGHNSFAAFYRDGATTIPFIYKLNGTGLVMVRCMVY